ncbi:MAG: hypothetical protein WBO95_09645 [Candidatus Dechloromonas phosphoritropha]
MDNGGEATLAAVLPRMLSFTGAKRLPGPISCGMRRASELS